MNVTQIISKARRKAKCTTSNVTDLVALDYLNWVKDEFWAEVVQRLEEDYNWQEWTGNIVAWVSEYAFPDRTLISDKLKTVKSLSLAYDTADKYKNGNLVFYKANPVDAESLDKDWRYYLENRDIQVPLFKIVDNSICIAPMPLVTVTDGMIITGAKELDDYELDTVEYDIGFDKEYHDVLVDGLAEQLGIDKGLPIDDIAYLGQSYKARMEKAIKQMASRKEGTITLDYPQ